MKLFHLTLLLVSVASHPGLLRIPKVYNAVITSNQNLSPSRAYPVIQPVIHRTAVGYVPPFYYTQIAPHFSGPEVVHAPRVSSKQSIVVKSQSNGGDSKNEDDKTTKLDEELEERRGDGSVGGGATVVPSKEDPKAKKSEKEEEAPLSFYPNYHSLYYDPYFYTYNTFNPHLIPGTYYVDYQPFGQVAPVAAPTSKQQEISQQFLPGYHEQKKSEMPKESPIPDVPPPPVPTSVPKSS